ncbi:hypothetical protein HYP99_gp014 [Sinorhizobium phage ort11]|uniref:Uncharacterized protein n=1 Tax=Sinorhizobium phage ort11 TaxID=2599764 RepID=A0A5C2H5H1_9CAUD|nr:hypothetical protein HYP99_gp014 [Sinorhizobium phage ort11]QEP29812.1 hypothetical protein Smphiort11_014 [Sinorhizobium phage ort11]
MHSVIKSLEHHTIEKLKGNDEHFFLKTLSFEQMQLLHAWLSCHADRPQNEIIIDRAMAPEWLLMILAGQKINAIKEVRRRLEFEVIYENTHYDKGAKIQPGLKNAKNFVEAMIECIVPDNSVAEFINISE